VHYALTYYIARQTGYTPLQAYRIASACVSVDYDEDTEPVQKTGQAELLFTPFTGRAGNPRWKFHAMRNEDMFKDCLGNGKDAQLADGQVFKQEQALWSQSLGEGNPGVFLHFFQDEVPHHGYGTYWGHWPMLPGCVAEYKAAGLPIGGITDWIAYRPDDVLHLCETTNGWLSKFMDKDSPHQLYRPYYESEYQQLIAQMAKANPNPPALDTELKRQLYVQYYAQVAGLGHEGWQNLVDPAELAAMGAQLGIGISQADLNKLRNGPDIGAAAAVVDGWLKKSGMSDSVPLPSLEYDYNSDGLMVNDQMADMWTLTGSLETSTEGGENVTARVLMEVRDAKGQLKKQALPGIEPLQVSPGSTMSWDKLPIGDVIVELTLPDGGKKEQTFRLDKRVNKFPPMPGRQVWHRRPLAI